MVCEMTSFLLLKKLGFPPSPEFPDRISNGFFLNVGHLNEAGGSPPPPSGAGLFCCFWRKVPNFLTLKLILRQDVGFPVPTPGVSRWLAGDIPPGLKMLKLAQTEAPPSGLFPA